VVTVCTLGTTPAAIMGAGWTPMLFTLPLMHDGKVVRDGERNTYSKKCKSKILL
jgi:hypothetical protein